MLVIKFTPSHTLTGRGCQRQSKSYKRNQQTYALSVNMHFPSFVAVFVTVVVSLINGVGVSPSQEWYNRTADWTMMTNDGCCCNDGCKTRSLLCCKRQHPHGAFRDQ